MLRHNAAWIQQQLSTKYSSLLNASRDVRITWCSCCLVCRIYSLFTPRRDSQTFVQIIFVNHTQPGFWCQLVKSWGDGTVTQLWCNDNFQIRFFLRSDNVTSSFVWNPRTHVARAVRVMSSKSINAIFQHYCFIYQPLLLGGSSPRYKWLFNEHI